VLEVRLEKQLRHFTLSAAFSVSPGELLVIAGPSGSGKTTILECIAGLTKIDSGRIKLGTKLFFDSGRRVNISPAKRNIGFIFQGYALFEHLTVWENTIYGIRGFEKEASFNRARELLHMLGIFKLRDCYPSELSGGERQRVALARALTPKPDLLLMDEPLAALDRELRTQLRSELEKLPSQWSIPVVIVTHCKCEEDLSVKVLRPKINEKIVRWQA